MDFAFLVHPLHAFHRRVMGIRRLDGSLALGGPSDRVGTVARLVLETPRGQVTGSIIAVPDLADRLVADQARALTLQQSGVRCAVASGARVVGLGSALAVVAGRGTAVAQTSPVPITTGNASTAWACASITELVLEERSGPVGILGARGTVGDAVAAWLAARGHAVWLADTGRAAEKRARRLGLQAAPLDEVLARCPVLVGASTTGPLLEPSALPADRILIDLALPPTLAPGPTPPGLVRIAGETLQPSGRIYAGFWGRIWLWLAGYGRGVLYACLVEPAAASMLDVQPWSTGRRLAPERLDEAGAALTALGFRPVLRRQ